MPAVPPGGPRRPGSSVAVAGDHLAPLERAQGPPDVELTESLTNLTLPSPKSVLTPPEWKLRAALKSVRARRRQQGGLGGSG